MYTGRNPKALLSIDLITRGFLKELQNKPYSDINIRDLCKASDVSRQTFYNLFTGKEDVLCKCIDNIFDTITLRRSASGTPDARQSIHAFIRTFYENRMFMDLLIRNHLEHILAQEFVYAILGLSQTNGYEPKKHLDYHLAFYAAGLTSVLVHWMQDADMVSAEELIDLLSDDLALPYFSSH